MTKDETTKILAIVTAAYPTYFKDTTVEAAKGIVAVWAVQFMNVPADIVFMAINKHINKSKYPPAISEIKENISSLYWDSYTALHSNPKPTGQALEEYERIYKFTRDYKYKSPTLELSDMLGTSQNYLLE